jgi:hypothetical protein
MESLSWWTAVSTILSIIFLIANIAQLVAYKYEKSLVIKEKEIHKGQVKIWQHYAKGIQMGLFMLGMGKFSTVEDAKAGVSAVQQEAQSLFDSLNEERLFTDQEIKDRQLQKEQETKNMIEKATKNSQAN